MRRYRRWKLVGDRLRAGCKSKKDAFIAVRDALSSHGELSVTEGMVEKSYYKVEKERRDPEKKWQYHRPMFLQTGKLTGTIAGAKKKIG
jgi:hypothetical protein